MSPNYDDPPPPPQSPSLSRNLSLSRLNAEAPEFVPRPTQPPPPPILFHPPPPQFYAVRMPVHRGYAHQIPVHHFQYQEQQQQPQQNQKQKLQADQQQLQLWQKKSDGVADYSNNNNNNNNNDNHQVVYKNGLTDEAAQKIINQVEYYFSDVNLATTDHLMRFISKDPDGYVPLCVVSSFKKIKALISSNSQLASILRNSEKLAVSDDGKRVKRQLPLTDADMEELQSRIIVAKNLPEDRCHQNLMKVFSAVGSVNSIRTCQPVTSCGESSSGSRTAKADGMHYSNKLHAFVEYESVELAEKAVAELNEEDNWRNGLSVCLLHKRTPKKSGQARVKKVENEGEAHHKEEETSTSEQQNEKHLEDSSQQYESQSNQANEHGGEEHVNEKDGKRKGQSRGQGKGRGRQFQQNQNQNYNRNNHHHHHHHHHHHRGNHVGATPSVNPINPEHPTVFKQPPGPRMPDGTRGFSMGRGKPVAVNNGLKDVLILQKFTGGQMCF